MKKLLNLGLILSIILVFGCSKATLEDAAKAHVEKQLNLGKNVKLDLSKLTYKVTEQGDKNATVNVSGTIHYQEQIFLVKDGRNWKVAGKKAEPVKQPEQPKKTEPAEHQVEH